MKLKSEMDRIQILEGGMNLFISGTIRILGTFMVNKVGFGKSAPMPSHT